MSRKQQVVALFQNNGALLNQMGIRKIGLFGSVVREEDTPDSDVDVFVEFTRNGHTFANFNRLCDFLEKHIGDGFDLVTSQSLSPYIGPNILREVQYVPFA
jgi:predicted nucleotidyltransferase